MLLLLLLLSKYLADERCGEPLELLLLKSRHGEHLLNQEQKRLKARESVYMEKNPGSVRLYFTPNRFLDEFSRKSNPWH
jgi:hypothetical protein